MDFWSQSLLSMQVMFLSGAISSQTITCGVFPIFAKMENALFGP